MKYLFSLIIVLVGSFTCVNAQQPTSTPQPTPNPAQELARTRQAQARFEALRNMGKTNPDSLLQVSFQHIQPLYRKPTGKELKLLAPNRIDVERFTDFLRQPNTGIIKLAADYGCAENTNVVEASEECLKYTMPGAGSSYSFRIKNYRIRRLADITFTDNSFQATGVVLHGIFADIGDVPMENVSLNTKGIKFLLDFKPESDSGKAAEVDRLLRQGIEKDGFTYRRSLPAKDNTTYILRSIAYRGSFPRAVGNLSYNEFDFDKRKDIIAAFRIIRRDYDGSVTILWKELIRNESPKMKKGFKDKNDDFGK